MKNLGITVGLLKKDTGGNGSATALGKIALLDLSGSVFTDLAGAIAYIQQFTTAEITETSFADGIFYFTVPKGTRFDQQDGFLGKITSAENLALIDELGLIVWFESFAFEGNVQNNILLNKIAEFDNSNIITFKDYAFDGSEGNNVFGSYFDFIGDDCFSDSLGTYEFGNNINFEGVGAFQDCRGKTKFGKNLIFVFDAFTSSISTNEFEDVFCEINFFSFGICQNTFNGLVTIGQFGFSNFSGKNIFYDGIESNEPLFSSATCTNYFYDSFLISSNSFELSTCKNFFYEFIDFDTNCFNNSSCTNYFYNGGNFNSNCFLQDNGQNHFYKFFNFDDGCFVESSGLNNFYDENNFRDNCFQNSTSENNINIGNFLESCFKDANPKTKNSIVNLVSCGTGFAANYTGRFDILGTLGVNGGANLPNDVFFTANLTSIHYPLALEFNDGGSRDADLDNIISNQGNANSQTKID